MRFYFLTLGTLLVVCLGCAADGQHVVNRNEFVAPPAAMMAAPGPMVTGPGPGVLGPITQVSHNAGMAMPAPGPGMMMPSAPVSTAKSQVRFLGPEGMVIGWQIGQGFAEAQLVAPGRYNFVQGGTYRLKVNGVPGRDGLEIYPTLTVYPEHPTTASFLDHNSIPLRITDEDLDQVETNNHVTKVVYLPDPRYQELAIAGVEELVSTRLDPGLDPVAEADRRGTIMAVLRIGNLDLEMPGENGLIEGLGMRDANGEIQQVQHIDGEAGNFVPPVAIGYVGGGVHGVPTGPLVAGGGAPGQPVGMPVWGMPITGTPIGLPGPTHLPYGRPAGLKSHTVRNLTPYDVGEPVDNLLIDVKHEPGIRMPHPVRHIEYTEKHPLYRDGEVAYPSFGGGGFPGGAGGAYCPPPIGQ